MFEQIRNRVWIFGVIIFLLMGALVYKLYDLTILQGEDYSAKSEQRSVKTISVAGQRGRILDRNGLPLAINQKSFNVELLRDPAKRLTADKAKYTEVMLKTIEIVERNGGTTIDTFAIRRDENMNFSFQWGITDPEAMAARERNWRKNMFVDKANGEPTPPDQIYLYLRRIFEIPEELDYEQALKVLSIWQEVQLNSFRAYQPIVIAYNVSMDTVAEIELRSQELMGMQTSESTVRVYPKNDLAAHVIGYMGRMVVPENASDQERKNYVKNMEDKGYSANDLVGTAGIETTMETYLTGNINERKGSRTVEIDKKGKVTRELSSMPPTDGDSVVLTIDSHLQKLAEDALERNIQATLEAQERKLLEKREDYLKIRNDLDTIKKAAVGAVVVMDVHTGDVLALASYPSYDLNLFTGGMSQTVFKAINEDPRSPLFNKAISAKAPPGSIFKMCTGLAGLMEGAVGPTETIADRSPFTEYIKDFKPGDTIPVDAPRCWVYPKVWDHSREDIVGALKDSCNYYFYHVTLELGIDKLAKWTSKLGLDSKTGIELPIEEQGQLGGQSVIYDKSKPMKEQKTSLPRLVINSIIKSLTEYYNNKDIEPPAAEIERCANRILQLVDEKTDWGMRALTDRIRVVMREELNISQAYSGQLASAAFNALYDIRWTPGRTVRTGVGQEVMLVTPIAVARYMAALVNGGTVYNAHIVKRIIGEDGHVIEEKQPSVFSELDANPEYLALIKEGMRKVVSEEDGGTAAQAFADLDPKYLEQIGGKTGSSQVSSSRSTNVDIENNSWFVCFTPYEKPEVVIVVFIPNGLSGASSAPAVKEIVKYYLDSKAKQAEENILDVNALVK